LFAAYGCGYASSFHGGSESNRAACIWCSNAQFAAEAGEGIPCLHPSDVQVIDLLFYLLILLFSIHVL